MKFSPAQYAEALLQAIKDSPSREADAMRNFLALLKKNGDASLLPKIARETELIHVREKGGRMITVESARPLQAEDMAKLRSVFRKEDRIETAVNPGLIAGIKIEVNGEWVIDATLRRKLKRLFGENTEVHLERIL